MVPINVSAEKVYSNDRQLWIGMTYEDAYQDRNVYEIFNFADKNCDKVIDESEMRRYNGPMLVVEKDDKTKQRFIGNFQGISEFHLTAGGINGRIVTSKEFEFYPGQRIEEINERDFNLVFRDLDLDSDGELSEGEIQKYAVYAERKNEYKQKCQDIRIKNNKTGNANWYRKFGSAILGGFTGFFAGGVLGFRMEDIMEESKSKLIRRSSAGVVILSICAGVLGVGYGLLKLTDKLLCKKIVPPEEQLKEETEALKLLDEQYKHVCVS